MDESVVDDGDVTARSGGKRGTPVHIGRKMELPIRTEGCMDESISSLLAGSGKPLDGLH